jgi:hypothetical protein
MCTMPVRALAPLLFWIAFTAPSAPRADVSARGACEARAALLEKRLGALQLRLGALEHELAARPRATPPASEPWRDLAVWKTLRAGMSEADVLRILGPPGRISTYYGFRRWEYPDALGARVNFDERGRLIAWGPLAR